MKRCDNYILEKVDGNFYFLPFGQKIADHLHGIRLNESGGFILELLKKDMSEEEIFSEMTAHYDVEEKDYEAVRKDLREMLMMLHMSGAISHNGRAALSFFGETFTYRIGPLAFELYGPKELIHDSILKFAVSDTEREVRPNQRIQLIAGVPGFHDNAPVLLRNGELLLMADDEEYIFVFIMQEKLHEMHVKNDGSEVILYYAKPEDEEEADVLREDIFHALRFAFLIAAAKNDIYVLHSASLCYRGRAWPFCASSGTGKSTHVSLWENEYGTPILNGDLNCIGFENNSPVVYGIPWCGTSGICTTEKHPLGGIVFLRRGQTDAAGLCSTGEGILSFMQRTISPTWREDQLKSVLDFAKRAAESVPLFELSCTMEPSAARVMKEAIDNNAF